MAENTNAAATSGATIDVAAITKSVTDGVLASLKPTIEQLAANQKVLADTLAAQTPQADKKDAPKALSAEDVTRLLDEREQRQQQTAQQKAAREAFVKDPANGLAKLPAAYVGQLGADPAKWAEQARAIAESWKADFAAAGGKVADVGGANREGGDATGDAAAAARAAGAKQYDFVKMPDGSAKAAAISAATAAGVAK